MSPTRFASRLKFLRQEKHLTQNQIAELVNVSHVTVYRWERGLSYPSPYTRPQLCELFGVEAKELFSDLLSSSLDNDTLIPILPEEGTSFSEAYVSLEQTSLFHETVQLKRLEALFYSLEYIQAIGVQLAEMKQQGLLSEETNKYAAELLDTLAPRLGGQEHA